MLWIQSNWDAKAPELDSLHASSILLLFIYLHTTMIAIDFFWKNESLPFRSSRGGLFVIYDLRIKINFRNQIKKKKKTSWATKAQKFTCFFLDLVSFDIFQFGKKISISNENFCSFFLLSSKWNDANREKTTTGNRSLGWSKETEKQGKKEERQKKCV